MPIYEYQCESCRHQLEALQKLSESPLTCCPACGKSALKKLMSASAFRLKGSGWYETDFKTGDKKNLATDSDSKGAADSSSGSTADGAGDAGKASAGKAGQAAASAKAPATAKPAAPNSADSASSS